MSAMALLLLLLVLAFIGNMWVSGERKRAFGTASGFEYVALGALLGPHGLHTIASQGVAAFEPIALFAMSWLALGYGVDCALVDGRRASAFRILLGWALSLLVTGVTASLVSVAAAQSFGLAGRELWIFSIAIGLVLSESARHAVQRLSERKHAKGPLLELIADLSAADDAPVLVLLSVLVAEMSAPHTLFGHEVPNLVAASGTLVVGVLLGAVSAFVCTKTESSVERWAALLGSALLAAGMTSNLGLSPLGATFAMGLTLSVTTPKASEVRDMVMHTEGAVLLPVLLLAGAILSPPSSSAEVWIVAVALFARIVTSLISGSLIGLTRTKSGAPFVGLGLLSSGTLTMVVALALHGVVDERLGRIVLLVAVVSTLLGELIGPFALKEALGRAGELDKDAPEPSSASETTEVTP